MKVEKMEFTPNELRVVAEHAEKWHVSKGYPCTHCWVDGNGYT